MLNNLNLFESVKYSFESVVPREIQDRRTEKLKRKMEIWVAMKQSMFTNNERMYCQPSIRIKFFTTK